MKQTFIYQKSGSKKNSHLNNVCENMQALKETSRMTVHLLLLIWGRVLWAAA